jgi:hypothetical protein
MSQYQHLIDAIKPITSRVRTDVSAIKLSDGSRWTREPLDEKTLGHHVNGGPARGASFIKEGESVTLVALLDYDSHGGETPWEEMVAEVACHMDMLAHRGLRAIPFRSSGGRGVHLYFLWDQPQDAYSVRQELIEFLQSIGFKNGTKGVVSREVEVFPKQDAVGPGEFGNQVILPLAGKSEPLDPIFDLMPMGKEYITQVVWETSTPVRVRQRPVVERSALSDGADPITRVRAALFAIPNDGGPDSPDYHGWTALGFAVYDATGGSDEGLDVFTEWSAKNPKFDRKFLEQRVWRYIKPAENRSSGITRATLYAKAREAGWTDTAGMDAEGFEDVPEEDIQRAVALIEADKTEGLDRQYEAKSRWQKAINDAADERSLRCDVCAGIAADRVLDAIDREMLAETLKQRFGALNVKLSVAACRELLKPPRRTGKSAKYDWIDDWVYITSEDKFYRMDSEEFLTVQGFNAKFNRYLPPPTKGEIPRTAARVALDEAGMATVIRATYVPHLGPKPMIEGVECVNLYRPSSVPVAVPMLDAAARAALSYIEDHVTLLCGGRQDVKSALMDWMAYNVQNPGKKVRWCPLIKGIEGDGKSLLGQVMSAAMGTANVKQISPKVLGTDFTGWAHGACIGIFEELRLTGHNRYDIHNAIKPFITNEYVPVHSKGKDEYTALNTMNYIAFTNHADALPLNDNDRRFFVVFSPFHQIDDLHTAVGMDGAAYFGRLFDTINSRQAEIRRWLLDWPISPDFEPNGRAPSTREKNEMVDLGVSPEEDAIAAALEQGGIGVGRQVLSMRHLRVIAAMIDPEVSKMHSSVSSKILVKMGWSRVSKQVRWRGEVCRIWHKNMSVGTNKEVLMERLEETLKGVPCNAEAGDLF